MKLILFMLMISLPVVATAQVPFKQEIPALAESHLKINDSLKKDSIHKAEEKARQKEKDEANAAFTRSWKFYFIMLAFPVILIIIFIFVFIRGKKG